MWSESSTPKEDEYQNTVENATHQKDKCQDDLKDSVNNGTFFKVVVGCCWYCRTPKISGKKKTEIEGHQDGDIYKTN